MNTPPIHPMALSYDPVQLQSLKMDCAPGGGVGWSMFQCELLSIPAMLPFALSFLGRFL